MKDIESERVSSQGALWDPDQVRLPKVLRGCSAEASRQQLKESGNQKLIGYCIVPAQRFSNSLVESDLKINFLEVATGLSRSETTSHQGGVSKSWRNKCWVISDGEDYQLVDATPSLLVEGNAQVGDVMEVGVRRDSMFQHVSTGIGCKTCPFFLIFDLQFQTIQVLKKKKKTFSTPEKRVTPDI